jgi:hypothetical protein
MIPTKGIQIIGNILKAFAVCFLLGSNGRADVFDAIHDDMALSNEAPLFNAPIGVGWAEKGFISMGNAPRGDATPSWWMPSNPELKSAAPWNAIAPWFVLYPGVDHDAASATNCRVKISNIQLFILKKSTNRWELVNTDSTNPTWAGNYDFKLITSLGKASIKIDPSDGTLSYALNADTNPIHGGLRLYPIDGSDVAAVFGHVTSQLILEDPSGPDNRAKAQLLISLGADYYPTTTSKVIDFDPAGYAPGVAATRFGLVGPEPRTHFLATVDPPGQLDTGSIFQKNGGVATIPLERFRQNPPPGWGKNPPPNGLKVK